MTENMKYPVLVAFTNALEDAVRRNGVVAVGDFSFSNGKTNVNVHLCIDDVVAELGELGMLPEEVQKEWEQQTEDPAYN